MNAATNDWTTADFNADGKVDITDANSIVTNFAPTSCGARSVGVVPEPTSLLLLTLDVAVMGRCRCGRHAEQLLTRAKRKNLDRSPELLLGWAGISRCVNR